MHLQKAKCSRVNRCPSACILIIVSFLSCSFSNSGQAGEPDVAHRVSFKRDVRPILSDHCFACHGPDQNRREAELRLDTHEGAKGAIDVADPAASEIVRRLLSHDDDVRMPPTKFNKKLSPEQIAKIKLWIEQGASWDEHWSFTPLVKPLVPKVQIAEGSQPHNPIDAFIQSQLIERGWKPAKEADRRTLIRRVTLDLTGLPPTLSDVENFLADSSPTAYEDVVARLLQSSAFGERMAWDWLDAARYADTNGYQGDRERTMWPWRDWVVKAFNENLPFDQFTIWQLAGDMLPTATVEQKLATGFCRNHMINGEGGRIPEENRVDYVMDMTETMGTVWLGLTLNCCRCHDHKFDPVKQREYYQLFAFFDQATVNGGGGDPQTAPTLSIPSPDQQAELKTLDDQIENANAQLKFRTEQLSSKYANWESELRQTMAISPWKLPEIGKTSAYRQNLKIESDQTILASGENAANDIYTIEWKPTESQVAAIRLDALQHESMTKNGLSRADSGNFVLTSFEIFLETNGATNPSADKNGPVRKQLKIRDAKATLEQPNHKIQFAFDEDPKSGWAVWKGQTVDRSHSAVFYLSESVTLEKEDRLVVVMKHESSNAQHNIGRFRLTTSKTDTAGLEDNDSLLEAVLSKKDLELSNADRTLLTKRHQQSDDEFRSLEKRAKSVEEKRKAIQSAIPKVMVMEHNKNYRETFALQRGLYNQPGDKVSANVPASLPRLEANAPADRLAMARWLVSKEQPLTARVIANRFWQQLFGIGLVKTVEDFGSQGEIPRYLDLLDWLAADFRDSGWDTKRLISTIVSSQAYRQSSSFLDSQMAINDPENRWIARGPRYRMPSWMLRDQALAASGLLVSKMGGEAVNGYQPEGVWEEASFGNKKYKQAVGDALYRRSLYIYWRRIIGPTMFFDNASRQFCTVKSVRTNTPMHALFTLNDVTFVVAARALATQALTHDGTDDAAKIDLVYQRVLCRHAMEKEKSVLMAALNRSRKQFLQFPEQANDLLSIGDSKILEGTNRQELASWTALCLAVFNLDETLSKE